MCVRVCLCITYTHIIIYYIILYTYKCHIFVVFRETQCAKNFNLTLEILFINSIFIVYVIIKIISKAVTKTNHYKYITKPYTFLTPE